ncbi:MAG: LLM class flavin-dependent oxidoreductase [Acidimicrobiia bacterium]|nr:LLM class flavin-dependent oxidoreductase [Acidimicrobiia bacterium]
MDLGITLDLGHDPEPLDQRFARLADLTAHAGRLGYTMLSTGEQHATDGGYFHLPSPFVALAALAPAAAASGMGLGTGVILLPAWDPLRLAYDVAVLDQLCGGRLVLGVAGGNPPTWARFRVSPDRLADRLDQTIQALKAAWAGLDFDGDLVGGLGPNLRPRPTRPGGPPVIVGGMAGRALRRAAELGDGWFGGTNYQLSRQIVPAVGRYHQRCDAAGRPRGEVLVNRLAVVVERETEVEAAAGPALDLLRLYTRIGSARHPDGTPVTPADIRLGSVLVGDLAIIGTVDQARAQLAAYEAAGVTRLQLRVQPAGVTDEVARRTLELLAAS